MNRIALYYDANRGAGFHTGPDFGPIPLFTTYFCGLALEIFISPLQKHAVESSYGHAQ